MPSPITPNNLKDKLPSMDAPSVCDRLKKVLVDFPKYVYEFVAYIWDEDGNLTESFKSDVCAIDCESITVEVDPPPISGPGGNLKRPILKTIAGLRHDGGIPLVWNSVAGATHYDIYKYKPTNSKPTLTDAEVKTLATRLRRDIEPSSGGIHRGKDQEATTSDGYLYYRKADNTCLYVDIDGGPSYDGKGGVNWSGSEVDGQTLYHYWVVPRNLDNSLTVTGPLSNYVKAFSKYVTDFTASGGDAKLLWSGNEETVPTGKTQMRVVLRGGGGAGAAGGDWLTQAYNAPYIKNITDNGTKIVFETYTDHGFKRGDVIKLTESDSGAGWDGSYTVSYFENSRSFWVQGDDYVSHSSSPVRSSFTPTGESLAAFGKMHKESDEVALNIPGGAGGGGALLVASFDVLNASTDSTNGISKVRCRTIDNSNAVVDYSARGQTTNSMLAYHEDPVVPWNIGGSGRSTSSIGPKCGEPHASDSNATNNGSGNGYFTVLEVYNADNSGQWLEVARVANGKGGGYSDVTGEFTGRGGDGGGKLGAASTTDRSNGGTGICTLNLNAKLGTGAGIGRLEYAGTAGGDSEAGIKGSLKSGSPASGGYVWDSAKPSFNSVSSSDSNKFTRPSNGFDLGAPGSGGSGSLGATDKSSAPFAIGGHAFAGCAWVTYSATTHNDY